MRIEQITVSWFRGAAQEAILAPGSKSIVVYGENGSGKSTFTDALEYLIREGKIEHLAHEYSGAKQEKAIRNTDAPEGIPSIIRVNFQGGEFVRAEIEPDGTSSVTANPPELKTTIQGWKIQQLILRQHEVAHFVHSSKGEKYSALLPLLGLDPLEQAAENVRQLASRVSNRGELQVKQSRLRELREGAANILPSLAQDEVVRALQRISERYPVASIPEDLPSLASNLESAISERIKMIDPEKLRHLLLSQIHEEALTEKLKAMDKADESAKKLLASLVDHRIAVLEKAQIFARELEDAKEIECPACGQRIAAREFQDHVETQLRLLDQARVARHTAREARRALAASLGKVLTNAKAPEVRAWLDIESQHLCRDALSQLAGCPLDQAGEDWQNQQVAILTSCVPVIFAHVAESIQAAPPSTKQLLDDRQMVSAAASLPEMDALTSEIRGIDGLIRALKASELAVRDAIREQTLQIVEGISGQAQRLWSKLHPGEPIEDIRLHIPKDAEKAIDIGLTFFGHLQPSPRLTLSEGHRNSLGLCIFLSLAQQGSTDERPIILDDVMSSLDRGHRGMLVDVICQDLADRQVIIFTHDREWFTELRLRLPAANWKYLVLRPWESPGIGIQWSPSVDTFDDAKALVAANPKQAGNTSRIAMDEMLSLAAERLKLPVYHLRGDRNDHRFAADFLTRFIGERDRLRRRQGQSWPPYVEPISDWQDTLGLLLSWANRASHTGSLVRQEARKLIDSCEKAVSHFRCPGCDTWLWNSDQTSNKRVRCDCGDIQWRYG